MNRKFCEWKPTDCECPQNNYEGCFLWDLDNGLVDKKGKKIKKPKKKNG